MALLLERFKLGGEVNTFRGATACVRLCVCAYMTVSLSLSQISVIDALVKTPTQIVHF